MADNQIYSATYSNVAVFEFVTSEGPVMRRKLDSYINATHILKIAKFPKAKRTRILEKDVQTRTHDKVQGGYGKYQGTYVPLDIGEEIARNFGIYDTLKPIFEFKYIEGRSQTPPPAPKHSHASASNVARKAAAAASSSGIGSSGSGIAGSSRTSQESGSAAEVARKTKSMSSIGGEPPRKRGRPRRAAEPNVSGGNRNLHVPHLTRTDTAPIPGAEMASGPSIGTFNNSRNNSVIRTASHQLLQLQQHQLARQDTDQDALQLMVTSINVQNEDLEVAEGSSDEEMTAAEVVSRTAAAAAASHPDTSLEDDDNDDLMTGHELFGTPRNSFEKIVQSHNHNHGLPPGNNGSILGYLFGTGLHQYHHHQQQATTSASRNTPSVVADRQQNVFTDYFSGLLNYFLEDSSTVKIRSEKRAGAPQGVGNEVEIPDYILNPPQPLSRIDINQLVDNEGNTILHWACSMANTGMIEFLLEVFKDFLDSNIKNNNGETPLMFLTRFSNSFQLKNFSTLLDLLFDSILSIDKSGRTVLHHIALSASINESTGSFVGDQETPQYLAYRRNKEKFARYYLETLFAKIIELQEYESKDSVGSKNELIAKVINHQDVNGNTAFHIIAYNLNKKLIKVFIGYHKYIDFTLKNLVSYTVEEYLASHNFILRLGNDIVGSGSSQASAGTKKGISKSIESQVSNSKSSLTSFKSTTTNINERLVELSHVIDKELTENDEKMLLYARAIKHAKLEKMHSQGDILKYFKLENLIEEQITEITKSPDDIDNEDETQEKRDHIIQDEIYRLVNDLSYEYLKRKEELDTKMKEYGNITEVLIGKELKVLEGEYLETIVVKKEKQDEVDRIKLSIELQNSIIQRRELAKKLVVEQLKVPLTVNDKENELKVESNTNLDSTAARRLAAARALAPAPAPGIGGSTSGASSNSGGTTETKSIISRYPKDDKLTKYCRLISLCCGMNFNDVEKLIDLIEQSLSRSAGVESAITSAGSSHK